VHQYDEELNELKKARRPGRPASTKEDLLKAKINVLEKEYQSGFCEYCPLLMRVS
jgi:translation machinery-associated protein 16